MYNMRSTCIVWRCNNMGVHRLPKIEKIKWMWIEALKLNTHVKVGRKLSSYSFVCSGHFKSTDFTSIKTTCKGEIINKRILKSNVVPTTFICSSQNPDINKVNIPNVDDSDEIVKFSPSGKLKTYSSKALPTRYVEVEVPFLDISSVYGNYEEKDPLELDNASQTFSDIHS